MKARPIRSTAVVAILLAAALARAQPPAAADPVPAELGPAVALVRRGEVAAALDAIAALAPAAAQRPAVRYLEGRLAERAGDLDRAIGAYAATGPPLDPELVHDAAGRRARLLGHRGRCEDAEVVLAALDHPGRAERALRAECALARGDLETARTELDRAAADDSASIDTFALRLALAEAEARSGVTERAIRTLRALVVERPEHPDGAQAERALAALAGGPVELSVEEHLDRADRLIEVLEHDRAVAELADLPRPREPALRLRLLHTRGTALFRSRHAYAEAAVVLRAAAAAGGGVEDAFQAARALSRSGDDAAAVRAYRRIARTFRDHRLGAQAEYLAGWLDVRLGHAAGVRALQRFVDGPGAALAPEQAQEARWHLALAAFRAGDHARAARLFAAYGAEGGDPLVRGRGSYWQARALAAAGERARAIEVYRATLRAAPLHWYALLSRQRLVEFGEDPGSPFSLPARDETPAPAPLALPPAAATLGALGLDRDARLSVRAHERELRAASELRALVARYQEIGEYGRPFRLTLGDDALGRPATGAEAWVWQAAYPRAFEAEVSSAAAGQGLDPEILWAVMRQESAYDPEAVSYADAIGLLQMLPSTAARMARALGVTFRREQLFDPAWNARYAAAELADAIRTHGLPLAFAGYNAGGHRVDEWLARSGEIELDLFVEDIPFDQTRNYVRRVTSHLAHYLYLRDPAAGWPALELPVTVRPRRR